MTAYSAGGTAQFAIDSPSSEPFADELLEALDAADIGYVVTDEAGCIRFASKGYQRIAPSSTNDESLPWFEQDRASAEEKARRSRLWRAFTRVGKPWKGWVRWYLPCGEARFFEGTAKPLEGGRYLLIANDRSDRFEANRAVAESEDALRTILNDLPVNVNLLAPDGTVLYVNHVLPDRLGMKPDDIVGQRFDQVDGVPPDRKLAEQLRRAILEEQRIDGVDIRLTEGLLAGTEWLLYARPIYGRDRRMRRYMIITVDRTAERRLATERGRFAAALAESQKVSALNDFAGSLAHELSNVLHPVGVYARRLRDDADRADRGELAARLDDAVKDAAKILRRTLTMARTEAGSARAIDVARLTGEVMLSAADLAPATLSYEIDLPAEAIGICQATELRQVLLNLLNNAAEAQHYAGKVRVAMSGPHPAPNSLAVAPTAPGPFWALTVTDEGEGMPASVRAKIFDPFFTTKKAGRGTGLGLPVVLGLVTGWGGTVTVESTKHAGATFTVWIPSHKMDSGGGVSSERVP